MKTTLHHFATGFAVVLVLLAGCSGYAQSDTETTPDYTLEYSSYTCTTAPPPEDPANHSECKRDQHTTTSPPDSEGEDTSLIWPNESGLEPECAHVVFGENGTITQSPCPDEQQASGSQ